MQSVQPPVVVTLPAEALARAVNFTNVPAEVQYGRELARSPLFRDPDPGKNCNVRLGANEYLVYFLHTRHEESQPWPQFNCFAMTNQRLLSVDKGVVAQEMWLGDIAGVAHSERGVLRWDQLVLTRASDRQLCSFGVYKNATAKFFFDVLRGLEGPKGLPEQQPPNPNSTETNCGRFAGKMALLTGATKGIGLASAKLLLKEGARVVICSRKAENVQAALRTLAAQGYEGRVFGTSCNVGSEKDIEALVDFVAKHAVKGVLDVVVCNAAISPPLPSMLDTSRASLTKLLDVNVASAHHLIALLHAKGMLAKEASVVLVSSIGGFNPAPPHPAYGVSKTAMFGLTKALATELGRDPLRVRVNCVAPGMIKTSFSQPIWQNPAVEETIAGMTALGRLGTADEIANCIAFLASKDASYVTGEILVAGGGMASRL